MWVDIGVNLTSERLRKRLPLVLDNARTKGLVALLITGTSASNSQLAQQLCDEYNDEGLALYFTAGIHPHDAGAAEPNSWEAIAQLLKNPKAIAVGECGLDFNRNYSSREDQLRVFETQLQIAAETQKPVFLHERDAFAEQIALLERYRPQLVGGVAHCFTGNLEQMRAYLDLDLHIGITGWLCDLKRGQELRKAVVGLPLNRVLLETDAPYLLPKNLKTKQGYSEPAHVPHIAAELAELKGVALPTLRQAAYDNSRELFGLLPN